MDTVDISLDSSERIGIIISRADLGLIVDALHIARGETMLGSIEVIEDRLRKLL